MLRNGYAGRVDATEPQGLGGRNIHRERNHSDIGATGSGKGHCGVLTCIDGSSEKPSLAKLIDHNAGLYVFP